MVKDKSFKLEISYYNTDSNQSIVICICLHCLGAPLEICEIYSKQAVWEGRSENGKYEVNESKIFFHKVNN